MGRPPQEPRPELRRTTVFVRAVLNENWRAAALLLGKSKTAIFTEAMTNYIRAQGLDPTRKPTVVVKIKQ